MTSLKHPLLPDASHSPPHIVPDSATPLTQLEDQCKPLIAENLETLLIGASTESKWPQQLKLLIADTILRGRFKYHHRDSRTYRVEHLSTLTTGEASRPAPTNRHSFQERRIYTVYHSLCTALHILHKSRIFTADVAVCNKVLVVAANFGFQFNPDAPTSLRAVSDLIYDVVTQSPRPALQTIDILVTAITGVPCMPPEHLPVGVGERHQDVQMLFHSIIHTVAAHVLAAAQVKTPQPGDRWRLTHVTRLAYLQKRFIASQPHYNFTLHDFYTLSKLDMCHAVLETGVALKSAGKKICYASPLSLTTAVTTSVADINLTEEELRLEQLAVESNDVREGKWHLNDDDWEHWQRSKPSNTQYGDWTSISSSSFTRQTLTDFVSRDYTTKSRVATNSHGDALFFVDHKGPWHRKKDLVLRYDSYPELMQGTVHGYSVDSAARSAFWWFKRPKRSAEERSSEPADSDTNTLRTGKDFDPMTYKPRTLKAIINKPGRVLVKRKGLRGSGGRFIVAGILALGIVSVAFNFAGRDNWLEIAFDGAQVMSLVAGLAVGVVYVITGTLTSTLDWLGGRTEVTDEDQLCRVLGASLEEVKVACTYEKEFLFWLSGVNSSFCPAGKYGTIMFSEPFDMQEAAPYVKYCSVVDKEHGLWLLQGWAFRIKREGDICHMVKVPYEDRVYMDQRQVGKIGGE